MKPKQKLSLLLINLVVSTIIYGQTGEVYDNLSMKSMILNSERKYAIYLPPDYVTSQRTYPVLYLLHGRGNDQTSWIQLGEVKYITDKVISAGKCTPMIIVMPDANTKHRGYFNLPDGSWRYEDFFFEEFIPYIEKNYRIKGEKTYRAIAGLSMGGGGTFMYALHHPEMFVSACPLSASIGPLTLEETKRYMEERGISKVTEEQVKDYFWEYSAVNLINVMPDTLKDAIQWYIDCGDDDFLYEGNCIVHIAMRKKGIPHEFRIRDGKHCWIYWQSALPEVLSFISRSFYYKN